MWRPAARLRELAEIKENLVPGRPGVHNGRNAVVGAEGSRRQAQNVVTVREWNPQKITYSGDRDVCRDITCEVAVPLFQRILEQPACRAADTADHGRERACRERLCDDGAKVGMRLPV